MAAKAAVNKKALAPKRRKGKYPSKQTLNLVYKEKDTGRQAFIIIAIVLFFVILFSFAWFVVRKQLSDSAKARNKHDSKKVELMEMQRIAGQYEGIEELYSHYGTSYMNADEIAIQDRMDVLNTINAEISLSQGLSSISLSGNTAVVRLMSLELREVSSIVANLESSPIVTYVGVNTAAMDREGGLVRLSGSLVQATITIDFKSNVLGQETVSSEDEESIAEKIAARKAAVDAIGG